RGHHQAAHAPQPFEEHQGRDRGERSGNQRLKRDGSLRELRQAHADWPHDFAGRHESAQLPALHNDVGQVKDKAEKAMKSRLQDKYRKETTPALMKRFGWKNVMAVPKVAKITVNIGLGEASQNAKLLDTAAQELGQITGQKAIITRAKKSIANFKIRKGMPIGCAVTLRGDIMYEFLDRLCNVVLPRVRDFRGLPSNAFDGRGNYTLGLKDQLVFPEIDYTRVDKIKGMNITFTTTAKNDEEGRELLK